ncbi:TonB-dependent receptor plug domain-containing protein [Opitutus sp. ER46]|uniref:TonB-dependent receptor plug domain-containing protein n=1 Tax=Opitutus sp. ER46 TaxID=2161864 RepID=UPI000D2FB5B7|nr:TonB-dependent receptor plug domain-containing protein [Opitutus sp. ER46]PTX95565.1 hypothetical protein DB354_09090 [Opitutus sp. ER46]
MPMKSSYPPTARRSYLSALFQFLLVALGACCASAFAADAATGTIQGRVVNAASGLFVSKAVVTVQGTNQQTYTDQFGNYAIENVPAGKVSLRVTYIGQNPLQADVNVTSGAVANQDFMFNREQATETSGEGTVVKLNEFVVNSERFKTAAEIAINEERYSPTLKNVVSAGAFGDIPDGNIGEFVKYIPGVQIGYGYGGTGMNASDSNATSISVRSFGPEMTSITIDGVPLTNASPASLTRAIGLDMMTINNASRVEVIKVATPDMPSNSPGGAINLISKSAFEYARPSLTMRVGANFNSELTDELFKKSPGPANKKTYKTLPSVDFTYVIPFRKNMGLTFTGGWSKTFNVNHRGQSDYLYDTKDINGSASYAVDLRPGGGPWVKVAGGGTATSFQEANGSELNLSNPVLYRLQATDTPNTAERTSGSIRWDWRPTPNQKLTIAYTLGLFSTVDAQRRLQFYADKSYYMDWGADYMTSYKFIPKGTVVNGTALGSDFNPKATVAQEVTTRDREGTTHTGYIQYEYRRGPWLAKVMANASRSRGSYKDFDNGHFSAMETQLTGGQIKFTGINEGIPGQIQFFDKTGSPLDWSKIANWSAPTIQAKSGNTEAMDQTVNIRADLSRELDFINIGDLTATAKTGYYRLQQRQKKWGLGSGYRMTYYGPALTLTDYMDDQYVGVSPGFNLPAQEWLSTYRMFKLWQDNPTYFNADSDSDKANNYTNWANQQKSITETTDEFYLMFEGKAFRNKFHWLFGAREAIATRKGYATKTNSTWNYVKTKNGEIYRDTANPNGVKLDSASSPLFAQTSAGTALRSALDAAGISYPTAAIANNSYAMKVLNLLPFSNMDGKVTGKPTFTASGAYELTENLTARLSWNRSQARPDFEDGVLVQSGVTYGITEESDPTKSPRGTIKQTNPNLKPWTADAWDLQLAYYTPAGGKISVSPYYKETKNFQETITIYESDPDWAATLLDLGLDPNEYDDYALTTVINGQGTSKTLGYEVEATQDLKAIGGWGRYFYVFGSYSHSYVKQKNTTKMSAKPMSKDTASAGISFSNKRVRILLRGLLLEEKYAGEEKTYTVAGTQYITAKYEPAQLSLDLNMSYQLTEKLSLFANARNVLNQSMDVLRYDKTGILPAYAKHVDRREFGVNWNVGIQAQF